MREFIHGLELCEDYFFEIAKPILDKHFPNLQYTAGLLGYGSDVLGYDDETSTDHMWGPRFYLFLGDEDITCENEIRRIFADNLPYTYRGYSVNFSAPDWNDGGVRHPEFINTGPVDPLLFINTPDKFIRGVLGCADISEPDTFDWLAFSEHRLLSLASARLFMDNLSMRTILDKFKYYPETIRLYLIASCWDAIACEQAFFKRTGAYGDELGSRLICARITERLMRLCFLYKGVYAPYSKWFGTAFDRLDIDNSIKQSIKQAVNADNLIEREKNLINVQAALADMHNDSGLTERVDYRIESYFSRDIKVIFADKFAEAAALKLKGTSLENIPLIGSLSQIGGLSSVSDNPEYLERIKRFYKA